MGKRFLVSCFLVACNSSSPSGHAHITAASVDLELPVSLARIESGQLVLTWTTSADAGFDWPFLQIVGVRAIDGDQDPTYTQIAFRWPGSHDLPFLHPCDCSGPIHAELNEAAQTATVDLDLMVAFTDESACPGDCVFSWETTDLGTFFLPDRPCDGGTACFDFIACPDQGTGPVQVYPDDAGGFTVPVQECPNPGLTMARARVVAHATLTRDQLGY